ncbi:hypothetical protein D3C81_1826070 [compost metagenome]
MRGVGAIPQFGPAEHRQCRAGETPTGGLGQVELGAAVLVGFRTRGAVVDGHVDVAVEGEDALLQFGGVLHHLGWVGGAFLQQVLLAEEQARGQGRDEQGDAGQQEFSGAEHGSLDGGRVLQRTREGRGNLGAVNFPGDGSSLP